MKPSIELEYRACISEKDFLRLKDFLVKNGTTLENDNKDTYFFIWEDKVIKVVSNPTTKKAKMSLKPGRIGKQSHFNEAEITLATDQVDRAVQFCRNLKPDDTQFVYQFRTNYSYKGVEIALKYTQSWGFHAELEMMLERIEEKDEADKKIKDVADELGLRIMSDDELASYTAKIDSGQKFGAYSKENFPYD
ncbi:MAG: hypothetical protein M1312_00740 [Patescibacteria group bacterium]|nr:hypothetical protein [Patescibacteria group bacterium]